MLPRRTMAFLMLALFVGSIISIPSALADDSGNPFYALWDAIFDLQSRDEELQAQIDQLRSERNALLAIDKAEFTSDLYTELQVETRASSDTLIQVTVGNNGPDRAAGVKLTIFYLMPLFEVNSINNDQCEDKSRGIIECVLGTLETEAKTIVTIDTTAKESGVSNTWTVDISTTTSEADYANNHVSYNFETGSDKSIEVIQKAPRPEDVEELDANEDVTEETDVDPESEPADSSSNSTSAETEESEDSEEQESGEQEQASGSGNATSTEDDQGSASGDSEASEDTQEEQSSESESQEQVEEGQVEEQGTTEEGPDAQENESGESGEENAGSEEGSSEDSESNNGEQESKGNEESSESGNDGQGQSQKPDHPAQ